MIIGQVLDKFLPITEPWIYSQIKGLENLGIDSKIFCHKIINSDSFQHHPIYNYKGLSSWKINAYKLKSFVNKQDAATMYWNNIIKIENIDLIHSHFGWAALKGIDMAIKNKLPHIVTFYGSDVIHYPFLKNNLGKKYRAKLPLIFEKSEIILCTSHFLEQKLLKLGAPQNKIKVWRPGINLNLFNKLKKTDNSRKLKIICAGKFGGFKGQKYLIKAAPYIFKKFPNSEIYFIGDGPDMDNCKKIARKLNVLEKIKFLGRIDNGLVAKYMSKGNIFISTSVRLEDNRTEALGIVLAEAAACGLPLVGSNVGGIPEVVINGKTGLIYNERDHKDIAEKINTLLGNKELRIKLGSQARKHVKNEYNLNKQTIRLKAHFKEALS